MGMKSIVFKKYKSNKTFTSFLSKNNIKSPTFFDIKLEISQKARFLIKNYNTITFRVSNRLSKRNLKDILENLLDTKIKKINPFNTLVNKKKVFVSFYNNTET